MTEWEGLSLRIEGVARGSLDEAFYGEEDEG